MKEPMTFRGFQRNARSRLFYFTSRLDAGAEGQVVTFNTLREDFAGQVFLLRHFSGVAAPVIAATMPIQNGVNRANNSRQASSFRGLKV